MWKRLQIAIISAALTMTALTTMPGQAQAQSAADYEAFLRDKLEGQDIPDFPSLDQLIDTEQYGLLTSEVSKLPKDLASWLGQHLPGTMSSSGMGSGINLSDDMSLSLGIIPIRMGIFNQFAKTFYSLTSTDSGALSSFGVSEFLRERTPPSALWPQFGASVGLGLGLGIEVSADVQFIPNLNVTLLDVVDVKVGVIAASGAVRWRINDPWGPLPALSIGVGGSYYKGSMTLSVGGADAVPIPPLPDAPDMPAGLPQIDNWDLSASYAFEVVTELDWTLYQINPEVRLAWEFGPFQPYLGFGFGLSFGEVTGSATVSAQVDILATSSSGAQESFSESFRVNTDDDEGPQPVKPAAYTLRPHVGFDINLGLFAITAQVDFAVMVDNEDELFSTTPNIDDVNKRDAGTPVAVVATIAARVQF